ncbi:MAG: UvrD-helicase domain-containing protein [Clostridia bacterium]|nr:UvrD-helicase domain-containing protein [Clostridia bacterium]
MARTWTARQSDAIKTRDRTLLVSAAAGSGKTATLTERIIRSVLDESDPINLDEMLIVTFTKAATGELGERISAALRSAIKGGGDRERLESQLHMLPSAEISTIDSFCSRILRANCERVGVEPGYRIIDTAEAELLAEGILDGIFAEIYEGELPGVATAEELDLLADCLTDTRTQGDLSAILRMFYDSTKDLEEGVSKIRELVAEYDPEAFTHVEKTRLGAYAVGAVYDFCDHYKTAISRAIREIELDGSQSLLKKLDVLEGDLAFIEALSAASTYNGMRDIIAAREHPKTPAGKCPEGLKYITALRKSLKDDTARMLSDYLEYSEDEWRKSYSGLYQALSVLVRLLEHFDKLFTEEKLRLCALEYSDVTRYTYECLWQGGERTDVAISESKRYRAIYVDEYQDVNALQHKIFEAISTPTNRFMVGDIKQSIYGFRGADPSIFAKMKTELCPLGTDGDYPGASIFMSENFRCDKGVIDFVNEIFDRLFLVLRESIGFVSDDRLVFKKMYDGVMPEYRKPEICLLPYKTDDNGVPDEDDEGDELAPMLVAEKIRELLRDGRLNDGRPISPGDIAIIMRNAHGKDKKYAAALTSLGIPSAVTDSESFFLNADILLLMSLLHAIDNPRRDIYLAGAMCSPVFGFSADEMVRITAMGEPTLFDNLLAYTEANPGYKKGEDFILWQRRYRMASEGMGVSMLINKLFRECGLIALASRRGNREELYRFFEHARSYESSSYKGLYNFLSYISGIVDRQNPFDKRDAILGTDEVKIITAHSSKGLEFPVVFFVGSEQALKRRRDLDDRLVYDNRFGIALYLRTPSGLSLVSNPTKKLVADFKHRRRVEEEARVLYVILTRARERLYVVGKARRGYDKYIEDIASSHENLTLHSVYSMASYTDMITYSSGLGFVTPDEFLENMSDRLRDRLYPTPSEIDSAEESFDIPTEGAPEFDMESAFSCLGEEEKDDTDPTPCRENTPCSVILSRFNYEYPYSHATKLPRKMSVSRLYPEIFDPADADAVSIADDGERITKMGRLPRFATGSDETESARRGIATHLLFQFCNLERLGSLGAESELKRLREEKYLSDEDADRVRLAEVESFRHSPLFKEMLEARNIWRELRFNTMLPADMFTTDESQRERLRDTPVLVQGVIDCLYEDSAGELHLIDYKTDRLTFEERKDPALAEERLYNSHSLQLSYYAEAVKRMFGKYPVSIEVYSLHLGRCVDVKRRDAVY